MSDIPHLPEPEEDEALEETVPDEEPGEDEPDDE